MEFTVLEALHAVIRQCENDEYNAARDKDFEIAPHVSPYKRALMRAVVEYTAKVEAARAAAELALIAEWRASEDEEMARIGAILAERSFENLVY